MPPTRQIPSTMDPATVAEIDGRLEAIARDHNVTIAFAIESGSRAWGFPSPDSDYDCRFVFIRTRDDYLALFPKRDVIETPLTPVLDVNGWDLAKALKLLLNGNAVIIEWLTSPIAYRGIEGFRSRMLELSERIASRDRIALHYLHLARRQWALFAGTGDAVPLKKLFYVLRPLIALRWLRLHPDARVAPMQFPILCAGSGLPADLMAEIDRLLTLKAVTRELGSGPMPVPIRALIDAELARADELSAPNGGLSPGDVELAEAFFRAMVASHGG